MSSILDYFVFGIVIIILNQTNASDAFMISISILLAGYSISSTIAKQ